MAWTTPKTNWAIGDYFNLSDMERWVDNFQVLVNLAATKYPSDPICFLVNRTKENNKMFYSQYDVTIENIHVPQIGQEGNDLRYFMWLLLEGLFKLSSYRQYFTDPKSSGYSENVMYNDPDSPDHLDLWVDNDYSSVPTKNYKGYYIKSEYRDDEDSKRKDYPVMYEWVYESYFWNIRFLYAEITQTGGGDNRMHSYLYPDFGNKFFLTKNELNIYEQEMINVYNFLNGLT